MSAWSCPCRSTRACATTGAASFSGDVHARGAGARFENVPGTALANSPSRGRQAACLVRTLRRARHTAVAALNPEPIAICSTCGRMRAFVTGGYDRGATC